MTPHAPTLDCACGAPGPAAPADSPVRALRLPSADQAWRYTAAYWRGALARLVGGHRLHVDGLARYSAEVAISEALCQRWQRLFATPSPAAAGLPFLHGQSVGTLQHARLFAEMGLHPRHVLHVAHGTVHVAGVRACAAARQQRLVCGLRRALRMAEDKALLELQTQALATDGSLLAVVDDSFLVRRLPAADLQALPSDSTVMRELLGLRRRPAQLNVAMPGTQAQWLPLPPSFGLGYGLVSGDLSPVHAGRLGARIFGARHPFLPGLGLRHLMLPHLAALGLPLARLAMTFASPAYLGRTLTLLVQGERFELQDETGRVVAFGSGQG